MMQSNPQIQELIRQNPELGHVLNDPNMLRQSLEMARNPALMQEMLRNQDRAMSNIEALPGGFDALRQFYTNVGGPLQDALSGQSATTTPQTSATTTTTTTTTTGSGTGTASQQQPASGATGVLPNPFAAGSNQSQTGGAGAGGGAQPNPFAAFGGGLPGMGGMGAMDPAMLEQMLSNPMYRSMMDAMAQNPQMMEGIIRSNPMLAQMVDSNPMLRQQLSDPNFMRAMFDPNTMQAILQLQRSGLLPQMGAGGMGGMGGGMGGGLDPSMFGMFGAPAAATSPTGAPAAAPAAPAFNPEERYANQIRQLEEMGFSDRQANIRALTATQGNVQFAIERLLGGM
jgi:ubiquilin